MKERKDLCKNPAIFEAERIARSSLVINDMMEKDSPGNSRAFSIVPQPTKDLSSHAIEKAREFANRRSLTKL